jgi:hypothetical protein
LALFIASFRAEIYGPVKSISLHRSNVKFDRKSRATIGLLEKLCLQDPAKLKSLALARNPVLPELTLRLSVKSTAYVFDVHLQHFGTIFAL